MIVITYLVVCLLLLACLYGLCYLLAGVFTKVHNRKLLIAGIIMAFLWGAAWFLLVNWETEVYRALGLYGEWPMFIFFVLGLTSLPVFVGGFFCVFALLFGKMKLDTD